MRKLFAAISLLGQCFGAMPILGANLSQTAGRPKMGRLARMQLRKRRAASHFAISKRLPHTRQHRRIDRKYTSLFMAWYLSLRIQALRHARPTCRLGNACQHPHKGFAGTAKRRFGYAFCSGECRQRARDPAFQVGAVQRSKKEQAAIKVITGKTLATS